MTLTWLLDRGGALGVLAESHVACRRRASKLSARFFTVESQTLLARQVRRDVLLPRCTHRILLLETLALRHQLGVLARSNNAFAQLTGCFGCSCGGFGPGGGKQWC